MHKVAALARALAGRGRTRAPYSVSASAWPTGRGIDMSDAPGYRLAAEDAPTPSVDAKLVAFAVRHGRLQASDFSHAPGYLWVGTVLTPAPRVYYYITTSSSSDVEMQDDRDGREDPTLNNAPGPTRKPVPKYVRAEYKRRRVSTRRARSKDGRPSERPERRERERILDNNVRSDRGTDKE